MTNTLHRFGPSQSFADDYIVFAMCSRGKNDGDALPKLRQFLEMAVPFKPVNLGDAIHGGALRPSRAMNPLSHWNRDSTSDFRAVIDGMDALTTAAAVFDNRVAAEDFVKAVKEAAQHVNVRDNSDHSFGFIDDRNTPYFFLDQKFHRIFQTVIRTRVIGAVVMTSPTFVLRAFPLFEKFSFNEPLRKDRISRSVIMPSSSLPLTTGSWRMLLSAMISSACSIVSPGESVSGPFVMTLATFMSSYLEIGIDPSSCSC